MSVHYKFKSALDYDTVTFDGLHISVGDLKAAISQQKRIGKTSDFDLQITNAQTKEVYSDDSTLISKNTSLLVARVPLAQQPKKHWEDSGKNSALVKDVAISKGLADLSRMEGSEQDKINAMITQSTVDYDPSNYQKIRGQNQRGVVPPSYTCYKCQKKGHWIKDCPVANLSQGESVEIRRSTGIPRSFMVPVDGPKAPGAMMTPSGTFAVPAVDREAYLASETTEETEMTSTAPAAAEPTVPDELICSLCRDLLTDAVMIPCCGNSFCDECIRNTLLDSEDHECPDCREKEIAPTTLIPNRFLRNSVASFCNQTGYSRRMPHRPPAVKPPPLENILPVQPIQNGPPIIPGGGPPPVLQPPGLQPPGVGPPPPIVPIAIPRLEEQRASTPTVDERREPMFNRNQPPPFATNGAQPFKKSVVPPARRRSPYSEFLSRGKPSPPPVPPGEEDPLEAFNRMIREKEMRARRRELERRRREEDRRRRPSLSRSRSRSLDLPASPPPHRSRSPRSPRSPASPRMRSRSRSPRLRPRVRYSRSRSTSRGRIRCRSPWSPPRRRRSRSLSLSRSPSLRRRPHSPLRYSPARSGRMGRSPLRSPPRSPLRSPLRSPPRHMREPPHRPVSPHRHVGLYDDMLPPSRNVEPPYGARYPPRNNIPPPGYPMGSKTIPPMGNIPPGLEPPPGYRGRYEGPPFDIVPPGVDTPIAGFEPPPFEKPPMFGPPGIEARDRIPPSNYRDPYRPPFDGPPGTFREVPPQPHEIPVHVGEQPPRFREGYRGSFRDQGPPFREGQPPYREPGGQPYRDPNHRGAPATYRDNNYRNGSYREPPAGFRDSSIPFEPPIVDPRESGPPNYHDPNFEGYRGTSASRDGRFSQRSATRGRGGSRRHPDYKPHSERPPRDKERFDDRETDKVRDVEKRGYDKRRDEREERRYDRGRDYEKDRDYDKGSPDRKLSPKRKDGRDKRHSESRGRSRDRDVRKEKKDERSREKSEHLRDHKDKEKKIKDKKKKKREKEKESEKKKKRDKKDKKDKEGKKDEEGKGETNDESPKKEEKKENERTEVGIKNPLVEPKALPTAKISNKLDQKINKETDKPENIKVETKQNDLYGEESTEAIDREIIQNYVKSEERRDGQKAIESGNREEPFDGIELQVNADELELKADIENISQNKEMLAPLPGLSKWEVDEDTGDKVREPGEITSPDEEDDRGKVTSEVIKRAEKAIFTKAISSLKPIEIKKISSDRLKRFDEKKSSMNNLQITVPIKDMEQRSIEVNYKKRQNSKTPPPRLSVKERLGSKVMETRVLHSTVERVKSRSKTPKKELQSKAVMEKDRERRDSNARFNKTGTRTKTDSDRHDDKNIRIKSKNIEHKLREDKKSKSSERLHRSTDKNLPAEKLQSNAEHDRKKSTLDEAHFEPDYDETVESDTENINEIKLKRERTMSVSGAVEPDVKKPKIEEDSIKLDLTNVKKQPETETESSDSDDSSSSSSSEERRRKRKKKHAKKKKKRAASDSDSDSDSSAEGRKKKKKRKHKKKSSKKKKKSKR